MKRALAERAKQSGLPNGVGMATSSMQEKSMPSSISPAPNGPLSSTTSVPASGETSSNNAKRSSTTPQRPVVPKPQVTLSSQPPQKNTKVQEKKASSTPTTKTKTTPAKAALSHRASSASSSPRPKKRARESAVKLEEEDEDDSNAASFYLRHQNRALASELRAVKYQLMRLEREREHRRTQCLEAVQNLNALYIRWGKIEAALQCQTTDISSGTKIEISTSDAPLSTGKGKSVEWIGALMNSLTRIGTTKPSKSKTRGKGEDNKLKEENGGNNNDKMDVDDEEQIGSEDEEALEEDKECVNDMMDLAEKMSERFSLLQSWISELLQNIDKSNLPLNGQSNNGLSWAPPTTLELQNQVAQVEAENVTLQELVTELTRSRDEMIESDRRVRRGLYRLAAGRVKLKEVLKAVANADEDKESAAAWMEGAAALAGVNGTGSQTSSSSLPSKGTENIKLEKESDKSQMSSKEIDQLKKQLADLNVIASSRNDQIKKLMSEKEEQLKQINTLMLKEDKTASDIPTSEEVKRSDLYRELTSKLDASTRKLKELDSKSTIVKKEWSEALADVELSKKALEDMQTIFLRRWTELTEEKGESTDRPKGEGESPGVGRAKEIILLQHKLTQALENVRQAETVRKTLDEAVSMNSSLQSKVDEFKSKYNALQAEKAARSSSSQGGNSSQSNNNSTPSKEGSSVSKSKTSSSSTPTDKGERSMDKLQRDYKRARKELAATIASKDAAKAKLERTEKEKDFLSQMNARLLKQASEKDEINAKSLSTILHLKQLSEQIAKEKENLEQQVKSAGQLALAARLASNARDRVAEEFSNEQKVMKGRLEELEKKSSVLATEKELAEGKLLQEKARMAGLIRDADNAKKRCEELATQSTKSEEEKQKVIESLAVAKREASEATSLSQKLANSKGGGLVAGFTAEQLSTQVSHLKNRLACPVCNVRDKKCILLRCRHMFCKQCVDENVKNRSRKCPACGGRFDTKDIADVWL